VSAVPAASERHRTILWALLAVMVVVISSVVTGYQFGSDIAHRENAAERAK
jgi:hypothetical protein